MNDPEYLTLEQAAEAVAQMIGEPVSPNTVRRWRRDGLAGVRLRAVKIASKYRTRREWLREFFDAATAADDAKAARLKIGAIADANRDPMRADAQRRLRAHGVNS